MRWGDINDPVFINCREAVSWLIGARLLEYGKNFKIGTDPGGGVGMYNLLVIRDARTHWSCPVFAGTSVGRDEESGKEFVKAGQLQVRVVRA